MITQFLGRLHPLLVHFPIGILILAFSFECLSRFKPYRKIRYAISPSLLLGALFAVASAVSGYFLSQEGGYDDDLLERHKILGIGTAIFAVLVYVIRSVSWSFLQYKANRKKFYLIIFIPLIILVSLTGHLGGSLTHGEDYLFDILISTQEVVDPSTKLQTISDLDNAVFYTDIIQPIFESRCYSCHSSRKQKGDLRLDGIAFIERGGENGSIIESGIPDSSSLYHRLMLPLEDEDHMPPNEKPQPSSAEIALIQAWINEGANFEIKISECAATEKIKGYFNSLVDQSQREKLIPDEEVTEADEKVLADLMGAGIIALPVSKESNYLSISFVNKRSVSAADLQLLLQLKKQIVWIDLARTTVSDPELNSIAQLPSLRRLNLEYTSITDKGLMALSPLANLHFLNLMGTKITDEGLKHIVAMKNLRSLFIYQTAVTDVEVEKFTKEAPQVQVDTGGYQLPKMLTDSIITKFNPL